MARIMMPEERNFAFNASASLMPWVSLPDIGKPKMFIEPVPSHFLIAVIFSSI